MNAWKLFPSLDVQQPCARFWKLVEARPRLKAYLANQFDGSGLDAEWDAVQGFLTAEILTAAWHTMFARMLPITRETAKLLVDDILSAPASWSEKDARN